MRKQKKCKNKKLFPAPEKFKIYMVKKNKQRDKS